MKKKSTKVYPLLWFRAEDILKKGGLVILPTDTLYGLIASAYDKKAIDKIYRIKERDQNKPLITLIHSLEDLKEFGIKISKAQAKFLEKIWPGKVTVEFKHSLNKFSSIRAGHDYSGFRMIGEKNKNLFNLIKKVGPIVAPSANKESFTPAETIREAKGYFGDEVDLYINGGKRTGAPSTLVRVNNENIEVLRQGKVKINIK